MRTIAAGVGLLLSGLALPAGASSDSLALADAIQPPVWIESGGQKQALPPGYVLQAGDRITTGAGARVHLALAEASLVKLGENAEFEVPRLAQDRGGAESRVLKATLRVLKGAFRFTTQALGKLSRREIEVQIGNAVTAGIRGTDIWGKSDDKQDLLCLLEGMIEVGSPGATAQRMDQPHTFYVVPRGGQPLPIKPVPSEKLSTWVPQTELSDEPALYAQGAFRVAVASFASKAAAEARVRALSEQGYPAEVAARSLGAAQRHDVVIKGLGSRAEARRFAAAIQQKLKLERRPRVLAPS